jgi:hypothetical protein
MDPRKAVSLLGGGLVFLSVSTAQQGCVSKSGKGDFVFVSAGTKHNLSVSDDGPMELLFVLDRPGADGWFRGAHERLFSQGIPLTVENCNEMGQRYDYVCVE